jgi:hypothetical protein
VIDPLYAFPRETLAQLTRDIVALRERLYPARIAAGKMTQAHADDGIRIARAHAAFWTAVVGDSVATDVDVSDPVRTLGASWAEMRDDCRRNADAAAADAQAHPADLRRADIALAARALVANLAPFSDGLPRPHRVVIYEGDRGAGAAPGRRMKQAA